MRDPYAQGSWSENTIPLLWFILFFALLFVAFILVFVSLKGLQSDAREQSGHPAVQEIQHINV